MSKTIIIKRTIEQFAYEFAKSKIMLTNHLHEGTIVSHTKLVNT